MSKITVPELKAQHDLLRADPQRFLEMMTQRIREDPSDTGNYFTRHYGWAHVGKLDLALADLDHAIESRPSPMRFLARGEILAKLGRHREALTDYAKGEAIDPKTWPSTWGPLYQAISFAALGETEPAVAACEKLSSDFWSPGLDGAPQGDKAQIIDEFRRRARSA